MKELPKIHLVLKDGSVFEGKPFGYDGAAAGEVVFNTGMVGYPETLTDPSYKGQILVLTYPMVGNYGVPPEKRINGMLETFESDAIHVQGLVVSEHSRHFSHWNSEKSLDAWLKEQKVPAVCGVDTRKLTKILRDRGDMLGKIVTPADDPPFHDPNEELLAAQVSTPKPRLFEGSGPKVVVVDCGAKNQIVRSLLDRKATVLKVPYDYDFLNDSFDGVLLSNGPGNPALCTALVERVKKVLQRGIPCFGICLGNQILALAAGGETYKLKFGHRSQNQPCVEVGTKRCYITSQNHSYAVDTRTLPMGWEPWFINANDGTNEGIRHRSKPFMSVQFHPEAAPGPVDTGFLFDLFLERLR